MRKRKDQPVDNLELGQYVKYQGKIYKVWGVANGTQVSPHVGKPWDFLLREIGTENDIRLLKRNVKDCVLVDPPT